MKRVLITGARAPVALDLARSFAAAGWEPHLADSLSPFGAKLDPIGQGRLHRTASPRFAFTAFADDLQNLVEMLDPTWVIPTCEEVFYVAEAALRRGFSHKVFAPEPDLLRRLHSKVEFSRLAKEAGADAPQTVRLTSQADVQACRPDAAGLVFKPEYSRFASHIHIRPTPGQVDCIVATPSAPWAAQDYVEGEELCIWSAARAGEVVAFAAYKPCWRMGRSASFYFAVDNDPRLLSFAQLMARATGATGQLSYDVIRRPDGTIAPLECNPRSVSGLHLFDAGAPLALALVGESGLVRPTATARHLAPAMWLIGGPKALFSGRLHDFQADLARSRDALRTSEAPRKAVLGALLDAGRFATIGLFHGRSAAEQSTHDIEWNGATIA